MWNDHLVGTVVPTGSDFPDKYGEIDVLTQDETLVAYFRGDSAVAKINPGLSPEGFKDDCVGRLMRSWCLVDESGVVERISFIPFIDIDDHRQAWPMSGWSSPKGPCILCLTTASSIRAVEVRDAS